MVRVRRVSTGARGYAAVPMAVLQAVAAAEGSGSPFAPAPAWDGDRLVCVADAAAAVGRE